MRVSQRNLSTVAMPGLSREGWTLESTGRFFVMAFLFLAYSRVPDLLLTGLRIPLITSLIAFAFTAATGGVPRALFTRTGFWLCAFTFWLVLAVPFSFWPGGSVEMLTRVWFKSFLVFIIVAGLLRSIEHCRLAMYSLGLSVSGVVLMSLFFSGTSMDGRLMLEQGVFANSNYLAQLLLMCLPFLVLIGLTTHRTLMKSVIVPVCVLAALLVVARTASRSGLAVAAALIVAMLVSLSWRSRLKLIAALIAVAAVILPSVSAEQRTRYLTIFHEAPSGEFESLELSALGSAEERKTLFGASVDATLANPLVGVGPGVFLAADADEAEIEGRRAAWRETHNMYTQVSSEAGIPAFVFFLGVLVSSLSATYSVYKVSRNRQDHEVVTRMAYCLFLSLVTFAASGVFSSVAYQMYLPTLAGLSVALRRGVNDQLKVAESAGAANLVSRTAGAFAREASVNSGWPRKAVSRSILE